MILIIPISYLQIKPLQVLKERLGETLSYNIQIGKAINPPPSSLNKLRGQYRASIILDCIPKLPVYSDRVLGIVDVDIYEPGLNYVLGLADFYNRRALISLTRLRQEYYGLDGDDELLYSRILKEAIHELGHTYGLNHCINPACVMHFSNSILDTDLKGCTLCSVCTKKVG